MTIAIVPTSKATLHPLVIRKAEDDPGAFVVGRPEGGEFVVLPEIGVQAIRLLDTGLTVLEVEEQLTQDGDRPDIAELVNEFVNLDWVDTLDGYPLSDPIVGAATHLPWLQPAHVRWLFARPMMLTYWVLLLAAITTAVRFPGLLPAYQDFFWTEFVGLATLGNTLLFVVGGAIHELMHLAAARSVGLPARIGLGTRLNILALQTDVSAAWSVPRRQRYRIYLAGMVWDTASIGIAILIRAYAHLGSTMDGLVAAYVLIASLSLAFQAMVFMRTDLYFVLMDALRCGDLFHDGLRYARYLAVRAANRIQRRPGPPSTAGHLPRREARAVRIYAPLLVLGSAVALTGYALFGIPVLVETTARACSALTQVASGGSVPRAIDGALVLIVEWGLEIVFLVTFYRSHPTWFRKGYPSTRERR